MHLKFYFVKFSNLVLPGIVAGIRFVFFVLYLKRIPIPNLSSFRQRVQNLNFTIYDCNAGIGGAWFVNKYPVIIFFGSASPRSQGLISILQGLRCDIPSHSVSTQSSLTL